jgi:hypothetical protein
MPSLADFQRNFVRALQSSPNHSLRRRMSAPGGAPLEQRFAVYRNNVYHSLTEALSAAFPIIRRLVGDEFFKITARTFLDRQLPGRATLIGYGEGFPEFLESFPPAQNLAYLGDVARLELAYLSAYHAADAQALNGEVFAQIPPEALETARITLHPALRLLTSPYPVFDIWQANQDGQEGAAADKPIKLSHAGQCGLCARPRLAVIQTALPEGDYAFLCALKDGGTLGEAAESAGQTQEDFDLTGALARAFQLGLFTAIEGPGIERPSIERPDVAGPGIKGPGTAPSSSAKD